MINNTATITKSTGSWGVGSAGGLDTGSFSANSTYHWHAIRRPDTGVVDVCFSLSAVTPTTGGSIPAAYTQFRRIGSIKTNVGSATWMKFWQDGDVFNLDDPITQASPNPGTVAFQITLGGVPIGIRVRAHVFIGVIAPTATDQAISWLATEISNPTDRIPNASDYASTSAYASALGGTLGIGAMNYINTDISARIRCRVQASAASTAFYSRAFGWTDNRGKDG
jgi:hypothetical protein